ncbi:MAG: hypothetical protein K2K73_00585 [Ureaplasma sp.]|nr:hypothetical protein [Ureaplasma sp.]
MKKIYRILVIVSFMLLIGIIIFFVLKINPKIKTKLYSTNNDYWIVLNTNELDKKSTTIVLNNQEYKTNFSLVYQLENFNIYSLFIHDLSSQIANNTDIFVYLSNVSLIKYLTNK